MENVKWVDIISTIILPTFLNTRTFILLPILSTIHCIDVYRIKILLGVGSSLQRPCLTKKPVLGWCYDKPLVCTKYYMVTSIGRYAMFIVIAINFCQSLGGKLTCPSLTHNLGKKMVFMLFSFIFNHKI